MSDRDVIPAVEVAEPSSRDVAVADRADEEKFKARRAEAEARQAEQHSAVLSARWEAEKQAARERSFSDIGAMIENEIAERAEPKAILDRTIDWIAASELVTATEENLLIKRVAEIAQVSIPSLTKDIARARGPSGSAVIVEGLAVNMTEENIARLFATKNGKRVRYDHTRGRWLVWNDQPIDDVAARYHLGHAPAVGGADRRWRVDSTCVVEYFIRQLVRGLNKAQEAKWARHAPVVAVEKFAKADPLLAIEGTDLDADPWLLGTPDGYVDLKAGTLIAADPTKMITLATAVVPAEPGAVPTKWLQFLKQATKGDAEVIRYLQKLVGYALTGDVSEHLLPFIFGDGGNGKGVFLSVVQGVFGEYARAANMSMFTATKYEQHPTELAALCGARLVTASETESGHAWAEARMKALTGGDRIKARFMRQDEFEFNPTWQILIVGNHKPKLKTVDDAMRRRIAMIEFPHKPPKVNPRLAEELKAEWPEILRWMIDGCLAWQREGLKQPAAIAKATQAYFSEQDDVQNWLDERCEIGTTNRAAGAELFGDWRQYAESRRIDVTNLTAFGTSLRQRGFDSKNVGGKVYRLGLRLKPFQMSDVG